MDRSHEQAQETRRRNQAIQAEARAKSEQSKAAIMAMLETVATDMEATVAQKLEAAKLAVQLQGRGY